MNDSEDAVRRLLVTAAEDIPPGIDLLRGVQARRRASRVRTRALAGAGAAVILTAAPVTVVLSQAPSALAQVTLAAARTSAQSYRVSSTTTARTAGSSHVQASVSGEFDPVRGLGVETSTQGQQIRYLGGYMYFPMPGPYRKAFQYLHKTPFPAGKAWLRVKAPMRDQPNAALAQYLLVDGSLITLDQDNPQNLLTLLKSATQVRQTGAASGPGWTGTRYSFTVTTDFSTVLHFVQHISGTVDVDRQGRVRRLDALVSTQHRSQSGQTATAVRDVTLTFGDFGIPVSVTAPPASQTYTPADRGHGGGPDPTGVMMPPAG